MLSKSQKSTSPIVDFLYLPRRDSFLLAAVALKACTFYKAYQLVVLLDEHLALVSYSNHSTYAVNHALFFQLIKVVHHFVVRQSGEVLDMCGLGDCIVRCVLFYGAEDFIKQLKLMPLFLPQFQSSS